MKRDSSPGLFKRMPIFYWTRFIPPEEIILGVPRKFLPNSVDGILKLLIFLDERLWVMSFKGLLAKSTKLLTQLAYSLFYPGFWWVNILSISSDLQQKSTFLFQGLFKLFGLKLFSLQQFVTLFFDSLQFCLVEIDFLLQFLVLSSERFN